MSFLAVSVARAANAVQVNFDTLTKRNLSLEKAIDWVKENGYDSLIAENLNEKIEQALKNDPLISVVEKLYKISQVRLIPDCRKRALNELLLIVKSSQPTDEACSYLIDLIGKLVSDLKGQNFQREEPEIQQTLIELFGILVVKILRQYDQKNRTKITEELKLELRKIGQGLALLNNEENTDLCFLIDYALEGIKRLASSLPEYQEIVVRLGHLLGGLSYVKDLKIKEFFVESAKAFKDVEKHVKFGWYDKLILFEQLEDSATGNDKVAITLFSQLSHIVSRNWRDKVQFTWKLEYGIIALLERITLKSANLSVLIPLLTGDGKDWEGALFYLSSSDERVRYRALLFLQKILEKHDVHVEIREWIRKRLGVHHDTSRKVLSLLREIEEKETELKRVERKENEALEALSFKSWEEKADRLYFEELFEEALQHYAQAYHISIVPDNKAHLLIKMKDVHLKLFEKEQRHKPLEEALACLEKALLLFPLDLKLHLLKAKYLQNYHVFLGEDALEKAIESLQAILSLPSKTKTDRFYQQEAKELLISSLLERAIRQRKQQQWDEAVNSIKMALKLISNKAQKEEALYLLADCYHQKSMRAHIVVDKKKQLQQAIFSLELILVRVSNPIQAHLKMGICLWQLSEFDIESYKLQQKALKHLEMTSTFKTHSQNDEKDQKEAEALLHKVQEGLNHYDDKQKILNLKFPQIVQIKDSRELLYHIKNILAFIKRASLRQEEKRELVQAVIEKLDKESFRLEGELKLNPNKISIKILLLFLVQQNLSLQQEAECIVSIDLEKLSLAREHLIFVENALPEDFEDREALGLEVDVALYLNLASAYYHKEKYKDAEHCCKKALLRPLLENVERDAITQLISILQNLYLESNDSEERLKIIEEAIDYNKKLLELFPENTDILMLFVDFLEKKMELQRDNEEALFEALKILDHILTKKPHHVLARKKIVQIALKASRRCVKRKELEGAVQYLIKILKMGHGEEVQACIREQINELQGQSHPCREGEHKENHAQLAKVTNYSSHLMGSIGRLASRVVRVFVAATTPICQRLYLRVDEEIAFCLLHSVKPIDFQDHTHWGSLETWSHRADVVLREGTLSLQQDSRLRVRLSEWFELQGLLGEAEMTLTGGGDFFEKEREEEFCGERLLAYAQIQYSLGKYFKAEKWVKKALAIFGKVYGEIPHMTTAKALNLLGVTYHRLECIKRAQGAIQKAFDMQLVLLKGNSNHPQMAEFYSSLGSVVCRRSDLAQAIKYRQQALALKQAQHPCSLSVVRSLINLGVAYEKSSAHLSVDNGSSEEAEKYYNSAYEMSVVLFKKKNHPDQAVLALNLGILSFERYEKSKQNEDLQRSEEYFLQAIVVMNTIFKEKVHIHLPMVYHYLGLIYDCKKNLEQALKCHQEAEVLYKKVGEDTRPQEALALHNQGNILLKLQRNEEAVQTHKRALEILLQLFPNKPQKELAVYYRDLGLAYQALGNEESAQAQFREALEIRKKIYPKGHQAIESIEKLLSNSCVIM